MVRINSEELSVNVIKVLIHIVNQLHEVEKANILDAYLEYVFVTPNLTESANKATVHEEMVTQTVIFSHLNTTSLTILTVRLKRCAFFYDLRTPTF